MKKQYYKPVKLTIGILIFGLAMAGVGVLATISVKDGVIDIKETLYIIGFIATLLAMIIGEGLILDAASFNVDDANVSQDALKGDSE